MLIVPACMASRMDGDTCKHLELRMNVTIVLRYYWKEQICQDTGGDHVKYAKHGALPWQLSLWGVGDKGSLIN